MDSVTKDFELLLLAMRRATLAMISGDRSSLRAALESAGFWVGQIVEQLTADGVQPEASEFEVRS